MTSSCEKEYVLVTCEPYSVTWCVFGYEQFIEQFYSLVWYRYSLKNGLKLYYYYGHLIYLMLFDKSYFNYFWYRVLNDHVMCFNFLCLEHWLFYSVPKRWSDIFYFSMSGMFYSNRGVWLFLTYSNWINVILIVTLKYKILFCNNILQYCNVNNRTMGHARNLWKFTRSCKQLRLLCQPDPWNLPNTALLSAFPLSKTVLSKRSLISNKEPVNIWNDRKARK